MKTEMLTSRGPKLRASRGIRIAEKSVGSLKIKNVLVPLDFSPASHAAIRFVLPLLKRLGANLHLAHVLPLDSPFSGLANLPMVVIPDAERTRLVRRDLGKAAENNRVEMQPARLHVLRGSPFAEICELARKSDIDLIAISTRGHTGLKHLVLGSTTERVVRYAPCPVLVVHAKAGKKSGRRNGAKPEPIKIKKILVPLDFSECSMKGLNYAKELAKQFNASLLLVNSVHVQYYLTSDEYARFDLPELIEETDRASRKQMKELVKNMDWEGVKVESVIETGHPGDRVCEQAIKHRVDLIVTSTHGTTGLKHVLLGSTAEYVVRSAKVPVLVVPSHERPILPRSRK